MLQSPRLKYYTKTIGIDQSLRNRTSFEHKYLNNIKKGINMLLSVMTSISLNILLSTHRQRQKERRQGLRQWKPTFGKGRIRSRSILQRDQLWTYARRRIGIGGTGWGCGGGNRW